jgi:SAM-dependent methyltransferase
MRWGHNEYGDTWASMYDEIHTNTEDTVPSVNALAQLAQGNALLELGVGTGRLAIPLAERGFEVHAIEISDKMLDILKAKTSAAGVDVNVHQADMCDFDLRRTFDVVFISHNTMSDLATQEEQLMCMQSAARHLSLNGVLILDQGIPGLDSLAADGTVRCTRADSDEMWLTSRRHQWLTQQIVSQRTRLGAKGFFTGAVKGRYLWPGELDLMARIAGLESTAKWAGWNGEEFTEGSPTLIAHYGKPVTLGH